MPLVRIDLARGKSPDYRQAIADAVYEALREAIQIPENDRFEIITEHERTHLIYDRHYLGIQRGEDFVVIQIILRRGRTTPMKQDLYRRITERLRVAPGIAPADVFITLVENGLDDWSFGDGVAQYVTPGQSSA
ncbi:MAG TPA: tautomerase family protein [Polyangiaceae bacterium]|nr:tautomerase family protein [Polyangiaceae bacterium]